MWNKHWGLLRPHALATPLHLQADVEVSVLSREGEGARISVNTPCTLSHPGAKLLGRQGAQSWVLLLSVAPFHGHSVGARVLAGRPSEATSPVSKTYTLLKMPPAPRQPRQAPTPRRDAPFTTVLTGHLIYHCTLVKVGACHLPRHLHGPAQGGEEARGVPFLNRESSQPCRVCLFEFVWASPHPAGEDRDQRGQRLWVSPQVTSFVNLPDCSNQG